MRVPTAQPRRGYPRPPEAGIPLRQTGEILPQRSNTLLKTFVRRLAAVLTVVLLCFNLYYELAPGYIVGP